MLGGHWWDGFKSNEYPSEAEGEKMARAVLERHLNITEEPEKVMVGLQRDCIPQYTVGHEARLKQTHRDLQAAFGGKLSVAGNWVDGVGLNDCVRGARDVVLALKESLDGGDDEGVTGLEAFQQDRLWAEEETEAYREYREMQERADRDSERAGKKLKAMRAIANLDAPAFDGTSEGLEEGISWYYQQLSETLAMVVDEDGKIRDEDDKAYVKELRALILRMEESRDRMKILEDAEKQGNS